MIIKRRDVQINGTRSFASAQLQGWPVLRHRNFLRQLVLPKRRLALCEPNELVRLAAVARHHFEWPRTVDGLCTEPVPILDIGAQPVGA